MLREMVSTSGLGFTFNDKNFVTCLQEYQGDYWRGILYAVQELSWFMVVSFKCCKI